MSRTEFEGPKNLLPDPTDIDLATDADLNKVWQGTSEKPSPSQSYTVEQAQHSHERASVGDEHTPSRN